MAQKLNCPNGSSLDKAEKCSPQKPLIPVPAKLIIKTDIFLPI